MHSIATRPLQTKQDVHRFFQHLLEDRDLNFHPDTPFEDYVELKSDKPSFTPEEVAAYNQRMDEAFKICGAVSDDEIYQIAIEEFNNFQKKHGGLQIGVEETEEFEMGGSLGSDAKRFTRNDYLRLTDSHLFYTVKDGSRWNIYADAEADLPNPKKLGYWNRATEKLIIYKPHTTENPLVKWLSENSFLSNEEVDKLAKGGSLNRQIPPFIRFSNSDAKKLTKTPDFFATRQGNTYTIFHGQHGGNPAIKKEVGSWNSDSQILTIYKLHTTENPLVKWLNENSFLSNEEVDKLAKGGKMKNEKTYSETFGKILKKYQGFIVRSDVKLNIFNDYFLRDSKNEHGVTYHFYAIPIDKFEEFISEIKNRSTDFKKGAELDNSDWALQHLLRYYIWSEYTPQALSAFMKNVNERFNTNDKPLKKFEDGGHIGFKNLAKQVAAQYKGEHVAPEYQHLYGKTYNAAEAQQVGEKVAAKVKRLKELKQAHYAQGGNLPSVTYRHNAEADLPAHMHTELAKLQYGAPLYMFREVVTPEGSWFEVCTAADEKMLANSVEPDVATEALAHMAKGGNIFDFFETRKRNLSRDRKFISQQEWEKDRKRVIPGKKYHRASGGSVHPEQYATEMDREKAVVYIVRVDLVKDFLKNYPAIEKLAKKHATGSKIRKAYIAFLDEKNMVEPKLGGRPETVNSPSFGTKTFYKYDWGNPASYGYRYTSDLGFAEVFQYVWDKAHHVKHEAGGAAMAKQLFHVSQSGVLSRSEYADAPELMDKLHIYNLTYLNPARSADTVYKKPVYALSETDAINTLKEYMGTPLYDVNATKAFAQGGKFGKLSNKHASTVKYSNVYWDVQVKMPHPHPKKVEHVIIELGPKSDETDVKNAIERMKHGGHKILNEGLVLSVRNMGHTKPIFAEGGQLSPQQHMLKADLLKLQEYSEKIPQIVKDSDSVEPWITSKIAQVEQTVAAVKHTLEADHPEIFAQGGNLVPDGQNLNGMLHHIHKYSVALLAAFKKGVEFADWMIHEITVAGSAIDEVYHKLDYNTTR